MSIIKYKINLYRRYLFWKKVNSVYIHIPKAAGTSINNALYGRTLGHYKAVEIRHTFPLLFDNAFNFSIVRNPWSRILSAYQFAKIGKTESMGIENHKQYQMPVFDSFEKFLFEWLVKQDIKTLDFVFQPQWLFVCNSDQDIIVDFIGKVENLEEDMKIVGKKINISIDLPHINRTSNNQSYRDFYVNNDMIKIVEDIYKDDLNLFGYHFE